jgi:RNA 3'-terminal phosphate cyclase (ATP)
MITIDGSRGEGGGQILRTSLALAVITGQPFRMEAIRARRSKPGLMRQHLSAVRAAAEVSGAEVSGAALGSRELTFRPGPARTGAYRFPIGTAGSATLVLQTVLPVLLVAEGSSSIVIEGGTHNPMAPPFDFVERAFLPILQRMGARVTSRLVSHGFYPAGGGRVEVALEGGARLGRLTLLSRGALVARRMRAIVSRLSGAIAAREVEAFLAEVPWDEADAQPEVINDSPGPGNAIVAEVAYEHVTEVFTAIGERGVRAEAVAARVASEVNRYLASSAPVGEHLADQLLLPMALGQGGEFRALTPSEHTRTQAEVIRFFLDVDVRIEDVAEDDCRIEVRGVQIGA